MTMALEQKKLVEQYSDYVVRIAKQVKRTLSPNIETDDLIGYGMTGLMEAASRFDPSMGANFSTFSYYRIRGAIYDGLRVMGSLSRTEYRRQKFDEKANSYMEAEHTRKKSMGLATGSSSEQIAGMAKKVQNLVTIYIASMEEKEIHSIADDALEPADDRIARLELYEKMRAAMGKLAEGDREIIQAYYFEEKSLEEVGKGLGLSKSWTCRKHARALERLTEYFQDIVKDPKNSIK